MTCSMAAQDQASPGVGSGWSVVSVDMRDSLPNQNRRFDGDPPVRARKWRLRTRLAAPQILRS
jgi:hypothetical protein